MVALSLIQQSNRELSPSTVPRVAVFVGGTAGIGKLTLGALAGLGTNFKAYVIGRKSSEEAFKPFLEELRSKNRNAELVWVEGEISLLKEVKRVCDHIKTLEKEIDLLFLTAGYAPLGGRENTIEGLDVSQSLNYFARICFVENLLPQLRTSRRSRVISVASGGMESASMFNADDLLVEKSGNFTFFKSQIQIGTMNTLTLERLAEQEENQHVVFIHSHPGIIRTGNVFRGWQGSMLGMWFAKYVIDPIMWLIQFSLEEASERYLYVATGAAFGGRGPELRGVSGVTTKGEPSGGLFLSSRFCDTVTNEKELAKLRATAQDKVWAMTHEKIGPYI